MGVFNSILNILRFNRRNWKAVALCIFAATVFWFFNALNKNYTANINFPLGFDYDKKHFIAVKSLPQLVRMNVTGNGWDLFKRSTGVKLAGLEIPLERPADTKKIVGSTLPVFFSSQLEGLQINFVLTDTLYLDLEPKSGRWIKLIMDSAVQVKKGYGLASNVSIVPDSIYIEGPQRLVDNFKDFVNLRLRQKNIDDDFKEDVEIEIPSAEIIKRNPPTVSVSFKVEKMITMQDSVQLKLVNLPSTVSSVRNVQKIPLTFEVPQDLVDKVKMDSVRAVLDLKSFHKGSAKLYPRVDGLPSFSRVVKIDSVIVRL
jgi:hypothetical protein